MGAERRRWERFAVPAKIFVVPMGGEEFEARVRDISEGGAFILSGRTLTLRQTVLLTFFPGGGEVGLLAEAEVVHVVDPQTAGRMGLEPGFGVQFLDSIPAETRAAVAEWIRRLAAPQASPIAGAQAFQNPAPSATSPAAKAEPRNARILVVQDNKELARLLMNILKTAGCDVDSAHDSSEAMAVMGVRPFDLVMIDWLPANVSGEQLMKMIRSRAPQIPIIVVSALAQSPAFVSRARSLGATEVLRKPFQIKDLVSVLQKILG